jgi:hypothetical protein
MASRPGSNERMSSPQPLGMRGAAAAVIVALAVDGAWVLLTAATGKTYHLAPLIAAAAPGVLLRGREDRRRPTLAIAALAVAIGWTVIVVTGVEPSATILPGQPGGVTGEVVSFGLVGIAVSAGRGPVWLALRLRGALGAKAR